MAANITMHGDSELSDIFLNDEGLCNIFQRQVRLNNWAKLEAVANDLFDYTDEQLEELRNLFDDEIEGKHEPSIT